MPITATMVKSEPSPTLTPPSQNSDLPGVNGGGGPSNGSGGVGGGGGNGSGLGQSQSISSTPAPSSVARSNAKDPLRPRRKKARRACFACQRAHLTCGKSSLPILLLFPFIFLLAQAITQPTLHKRTDLSLGDERPCQRCIKRGLQDACHDGVRKKAKYLHDAPIDDRPPEFAPQPSLSPAGSYPYPHPQLSQPSVVTEMLPPDGTLNPISIESPGAALVEQAQQHAFSQAPMFDPSDPALFNFDIASLNFESHYGALEFGVLGQMSNGGGNTTTNGGNGVATPDNNNSGPGSAYDYSPGVDAYVGFPAPQDAPLGDGWGTSRSARPAAGAGDGTSGFANTYMIEAGPGSLTSPSPPVESPRQNYTPVGTSATVQGSYAARDEAPTTLGSPSFLSPPPQPQNRPAQPSALHQVQSASHQISAQIHQHQRRRRPDDPSQIYSSITQPYPYALQHHRLFHMLETRFPKASLLRIARAMASFRPSFIACTQTLKAEDLLFMERCFQRTLWEYERFIQSCGTPTIVCRRTGEVVCVGKEFCMLTGWERAVLLGSKPNRNTNRPFVKPPGAGPGVLQPPPEDDVQGGVRRPVFLAELLDDESVVEFYEQFALLAFGDSRGAVTTTCKVLTYQALPEDGDAKDGIARKSGGLAGKEGKVDCAFCWTIKRDIFDIPMLVVGNVSDI